VSQPTTHPQALRDLLSQIDSCERDARAQAGGLTDAQINWQPGGTAWSVGQCLEHLALMNVVYLKDMDAAVRQSASRGTGGFRGLAPTALGRWFVSTMEPPVKRKVTTFAPLVPPSSVSRDDVLRRYEESHEAYRDLVTACAAVDVNRVIVRNPFYHAIRMRMSTVLLVIPAHDRRHLWQARQVLADPRFPQGPAAAARATG
jgi:hypothetical protein